MGCDAVGRERLIVSNGWKYFTSTYGRRKGRKIKVEMHSTDVVCRVFLEGKINEAPCKVQVCEFMADREAQKLSC